MEKDPVIKKLLEKYQSEINKGLDIPQVVDETQTPIKRVTTREYSQFKEEYLPPTLSAYEKWCNKSEQILKVSSPKEKEAELKESIEICHLAITPEGATSLSYLLPMIIGFGGIFFSLLVLNSTFYMLIFAVAAAVLYTTFSKLPMTLANNWRMQASSQMVLSIFYVVTYMRHTSNLELAIEFAAEHLSGPLALDMRKVIWDVETEQYESVRESLDIYLETWRKWNREFVESFHLIESSLFESSESRRLDLLDKSLTVMLDETYEKMLHYAQNLKSPITMLHMMGVILPILGLVILPLIVSFMEGVKWYTIATIYDFVIPVAVYFMGKSILAKRPTGYGDTDISETSTDMKRLRNVIIPFGKSSIAISPAYFAGGIAAVCILIALSPLYLHAVGFPDFTFGNGAFKFLGYKTTSSGDTLGPFGLGATIISLFFPIGMGLGIGLWHKLRSKNVLAIREQTKRLEAEFASALFQLGNRLGDGIPLEIAFSRVAETMQGTDSGRFFRLVSSNITKLGMSVDTAIFNPHNGAITEFPSKIIDTSMKVLMESSKKGPHVAANALLNVARYIKEMHKVDERLKDLLSDIISSMKSQISFMSPVISGIVIGITSMVTSILSKLTDQMTALQDDAAEGAAGGFSGVATLFSDGMPTFWFQIIVGVYVALIVYILTILSNGIENGQDKLNERFLIGRNMIKSILLYVVIAGAITIAFNVIAATLTDTAAMLS